MIVTTEQIKQHLNITFADDDDLLDRQIAAAQNQIERQLGYKIEDEYGGEGQDEIPPALVEAVSLLTGHYYENREASVSVSMMPIPLGVADIVREFRCYSFGVSDDE